MASDYLLVIEGIEGESQDDKHRNAIEIESFSWGDSNSGSASLGGGAGTGKVTFHDFHFTTHINKASPNVMLSCALGKHIKKATLFLRKATGDGQQEYGTITMEEAVISSWQSSGSGGSSSNQLPVDQFSLNFSKIKFEYKPQKADGGLDAPVTSGWDVKANRKQ